MHTSSPARMSRVATSPAVRGLAKRPPLRVHDDGAPRLWETCHSFQQYSSRLGSLLREAMPGVWFAQPAQRVQS